MKYYYQGTMYEMQDNLDDTEYDKENLDLVHLGLILGQPKYKDNGIEVDYKGRKIIITPSVIKRQIKPLPRYKKDIKYDLIPAYSITDGKSGGTIPKKDARDFLKSIKNKLDNNTINPITEGFFKSLAHAATDSVLKGMGFGQVPGQAKDAMRLPKEKDKKNANRKER